MTTDKTTRTVDDVLRDYAVIFSGRTRYVGQEPSDDELLVAEIERLRLRLRKIANAPVPQTNEIAVMLTEWAQPRDGEVA